MNMLKQRVKENERVRQKTDAEIVRAIEHYTNSLQRGLRQANTPVTPLH